MLKTGLAITLSIYAALFLQLEPPSFAAIAATFAIQPSVYKSYESIVENFQGNVIGAILAILFYGTFGNAPFIIGITVILAIAVNLKLHLEKAVPLTLVTIIIMMSGTPEGGFIVFAFERFALVMIGVLASFFINLLFMPPKFETKLFAQNLQLTEDMMQTLRLMTRHESDSVRLKETIARYRKKRSENEQLYFLYKEERTYLKKQMFIRARKLVVFRQMMMTTQKLLDLIHMLQQIENDFSHLPERLQEELREMLDAITHEHERTLLQFSGQSRAGADPYKLDVEKLRQLAEGVLTYKRKEHNRQWMLLPLIGLVVDYWKQVDLLQKRMDQYRTTHEQE